jgi:Cu2+-exporting ATPase
VVRNGEELVIPTTEIRVGDLVIVRAGDRFPVDGKVKRGEAMVDEQLLTGESQLILKTKGSRVKTGTTNTDGLLKVVATSVGKETVLARIIDHVKRAQGTKPLIQKRVDRISSIFVPVVVAIAALTFLVWGFVIHPNDWVSALMSMVTVLIVACPCALGLATPTALMVGVGKASKQGILIRDANVLETLSSVSDLIVDKTGTLTEGKPFVKDVKVFEADNLIALSVLSGLMKSSKHPLSEAIVNHLQGQNSSAEVSDISTLAGKGVTGIIEGQLCSAGSERFMIEQGVELDTQRYMGNDSCVYWAKGKNLLGYVTLHDEVKQGVAETIHWLKKRDIKIHLLSGDRKNVVQQLADDLGLSIWKAQYSPSDKADYTQKLQETGSVVAMVGDGINDAVALTQAQIGISMSTGAEIAIDASEIALLHGDFSLVKSAMQISEDTLRTVNQNLFWAFIYNIIAIPIAAGVLYPINGFVINPMIASFAMSFSSVSVLLNSLRLNLKRLR